MKAATRAAAIARGVAPPPWAERFAGRSLILSFPAPYWTLGWAPLGGGLRQARAIVNHQVLYYQREATEKPRPYLARLMRELGLRAAPAAPAAIAASGGAAGASSAVSAISMMTGADVRTVARARAARLGLMAGAWCTAGCSNALRVGDRATVGPVYAGTINLIVAVNQRLVLPALAEALSLATEARVLAMLEAGVASSRSGAPATGTGTDCIVIAAPAAGPAHAFCGKHTLLGELIGRAALGACARALAASRRLG